MGTGALRRDQIVHIDGAQYRLLRMITDTRWQLEQLNTLHVREFEINELLRLIVDKRLAFPNEINALVVGPPGSESSEGIAEIIKIRRMYAKAAMGVPNTRKKLEQVIDEVWNQIRLPQPKPGYVTVYRWKRRFSQSGGDYRILADHTQLKGNRKSRFKPEVISLCRQAIAEKYMRREGCSIQKTLDHALHMVQRENRSPFALKGDRTRVSLLLIA
jgi:hypothetical protein